MITDRSPAVCSCSRWRTKRGSVRSVRGAEHVSSRIPRPKGESVDRKTRDALEVRGVAVSLGQECRCTMRREHRERAAVVAEVSDPEAIVGYERLQRSREIVDESSRLKLLLERPRDGRRDRQGCRLPAVSARCLAWRNPCRAPAGFYPTSFARTRVATARPSIGGLSGRRKTRSDSGCSGGDGRSCPLRVAEVPAATERLVELDVGDAGDWRGSGRACSAPDRAVAGLRAPRSSWPSPGGIDPSRARRPPRAPLTAVVCPVSASLSLPSAVRASETSRSAPRTACSYWSRACSHCAMDARYCPVVRPALKSGPLSMPATAHTVAPPPVRADSSGLAAPNSAVRLSLGKNSAFATPMRALAATSCCSA